MGPNPWSTRATKTVYDNGWISVREDAVVRPDGSDGIYGVVKFKNHALGAVPLFDDGTTVLVGQHRYPLDAWSWEIPEGGGPVGRDALSEIRRELREETGLTAERWTPLGAAHLSNSVTDETGYAWLAEGLTQGPSEPEPTERLRLRRLPFVEAVQMAVDGRITDALSIIALCRAERLLASR
ncbi:MAG TPA: NUDIX hydrolase [Egibacteraceae bacterium]|nr:NUDIX hydrolase [Egibacteraceae bacterium]